MPGDIRQHALQHFSEVAVVLFVAFRRPDVRGATGDVDDDVPVAARRWVVEASSNGCFTLRSSSTVPMPLCTSTIGVVTGRIAAVLHRV